MAFEILKAIKDSALELLFPGGFACVLCGSELRGEEDVCDSCEKAMPYILRPCKRCGSETTGEGAYCLRCLAEPPDFDKAVSVFRYEGGARRLITFFKGGRRENCRYAAARMAEKIAAELPAYDILTYVPMTPAAVRVRGFNQSRMLAEEIGVRLGGKPEELLVKARETRFQKSLSLRERRANLSGAIKAADGVSPAGKRVLVIDDILTTGSTLSECAGVLRKKGADKVYGAVLCSVVREYAKEIQP
jgi:ComF family protein